MEQSKKQQCETVFNVMEQHSVTLTDLLSYLLLQRKQELLNLISSTMDEDKKQQYRNELEEVRGQLLAYGF